MKQIFKYPILVEDQIDAPVDVTAHLPHRAHWRLIDLQDGDLSVWAEVETDGSRPMLRHEFKLVGTGMVVPDEFVHVHSWQQTHSRDGLAGWQVMAVWHLYIKDTEHPSQEDVEAAERKAEEAAL